MFVFVRQKISKRSFSTTADAHKIEDTMKDLRALFNNAPDLTVAIKKYIDENAGLKKQIETFVKEKAASAKQELIRKRGETAGTKLLFPMMLFLLIVMIVSIFVFAFLGWPDLWLRILSRILLLPVVAGISYEIIRFAGRSKNSLVRLAIMPGLWLQYLTTREPDDSMIEVAIKSLEAVQK